MARGHPDYQTYAGPAAGGGRMLTASFSYANIPSGATGNIDVPAVAADTRHSIVQLSISCLDDTAIHKVQLIRINDLWLFFQGRFVTNGTFDIKADDLVATQQIRIAITNNSAGALTFTGTISYIVKDL